MIERATAAYNAGRWDEAAALCTQVLKAEPNQADALLILGSIHANRGDADGATPLLQGAYAHRPQDDLFLHGLGAALNAIGYLDEARIVLEEAVALNPRAPELLHALGNVHLRLGNRVEAKHLLERVVALDARFALAFAGLGTLALGENKLEDAERHCRRALELAPEYSAALITLSEVALRRKDFDGAVDQVDRALAGNLAPSQRVAALSVRGQALERSNRFEDAFRAFEQANALDETMYAQRFAARRHATSPDAVAQLENALRTADPALWPRPRAQGRTPVFLIGFPRSGTTLLGQMLGSHPDVETLDESENFVDATNALLLPQAAPETWTGLRADAVEALRDQYWMRAERALGRAPAGVLLDKMPMNIVALPLIRLLFPEAKVLLILRDPRDVVISCFKQRFAPNPATVQFLRLDTCVAYYDIVMRLLETARERLGLDICTVRYEALTQDYRPVVTQALKHIGLDWDGAVAEYAKTAEQSRILTPSAFAATQPVYTSAVGAWRRYEAQLAPHLPHLQDWVRRIGEGALG